MAGRRATQNMKKKKTNCYVYILRCSDGSLYTGITKDLPRRVSEHNRKKGSAYVQAHLPAKLVYKEPHKTKSKALKREFQIKQWSRQKKLALINGNKTLPAKLSKSRG